MGVQGPSDGAHPAGESPQWLAKQHEQRQRGADEQASRHEERDEEVTRAGISDACYHFGLQEKPCNSSGCALGLGGVGALPIFSMAH